MYGTEKKYIERKMKSIYIVQNENKKIKIGVSENVESRVNVLSKQGGFKICKLFNTEPCSNAYEIEGVLHQYFSGNRISGEWFDIGFNIAKEKLKECFKNKACFDKKYIPVPSMEEKFSNGHNDWNISEERIIFEIISLVSELREQYFNLDYPETENEMFQIAGDYYQMARMNNNKVLYLTETLCFVIQRREQKIKELESRIEELKKK